MVDSEMRHQLVGLLINTAKAHHVATGGINPEWPRWYAEHAVDDLNGLLDSDMSIDDLAEWLAQADRRYHEESLEESWPKAYATWLLEESA